jgi:hypothetical protein
MKLEDLKTGDQITHYCFGELIEATVIQRSGIGVCTEHEPQIWGNQVFKNTWINPATQLQHAATGAETTPKAFYKGKPVTV